MEKSELPIKNKKSVFLGHTEINGKMEKVYIQEEDRLKHIQSFGASGSGKTTLMQNVIIQDIEMGNGVFVLDPTGNLVSDILSKIPEHRKNDVVYFDAANTQMSLNLLEANEDKSQVLVIDSLFRILHELYDLKATGGPMFDVYMKNSIKLVLAHPESGCTLADVCKVLTDRDFRRYKLAFCDDEDVANFWDEASKVGGEANLENMVPYLISKLAPFLSDELPKSIFGQQKSNLDFVKYMKNNKIVLISLNKNKIGEKMVSLLGLVIVELIFSAGISRESNNIESYNKLTPFFVYLDQINNYLGNGLGKIIEELRLYKVGVYLTYNYFGQLSQLEKMRDCLMASCGTKFVFQCANSDAEILKHEFLPNITMTNLIRPKKYAVNTVLLIDDQRSRGFSLKVPASSENMDDQKPKLWKNSKTATN